MSLFMGAMIVLGKGIKSMDELVEDIGQRAIGQSIEVTLLRGGKRITVSVYLTEMPRG